MAPVCAVVVAGGSGQRFGNPGGKQLVNVAGRPLMSWSIRAFDRSDKVGHIVVVCPAERRAEMRRLARGGNDDLDAAIGGRLGPLVHLCRVAMGAGNDQFVRHAQGVELGRATLHDGHVGLRAHDNAHERGLLGSGIHTCTSQIRVDNATKYSRAHGRQTSPHVECVVFGRERHLDAEAAGGQDVPCTCPFPPAVRARRTKRQDTRRLLAMNPGTRTLRFALIYQLRRSCAARSRAGRSK